MNMATERISMDDPRVQRALEELKSLVLQRFPEATFEAYEGDDPVGIYLKARADVEDLFDIIYTVSERIVDIQLDEELPVYVVPGRPWKRELQRLKKVRRWKITKSHLDGLLGRSD